MVLWVSLGTSFVLQIRLMTAKWPCTTREVKKVLQSVPGAILTLLGAAGVLVVPRWCPSLLRGRSRPLMCLPSLPNSLVTTLRCPWSVLLARRPVSEVLMVLLVTRFEGRTSWTNVLCPLYVGQVVTVVLTTLCAKGPVKKCLTKQAVTNEFTLIPLLRDGRLFPGPIILTTL